MEIVIATTPGREMWVKDCMESVGRDCLVVSQGGKYSYELGKIKYVLEKTNIDRFLFLQDTVIIKDKKLLEICEQQPKSVIFTYPAGCYLGVYCRDTLMKTGIPEVNSKVDSVHYENAWIDQYRKNEPNIPVLFFVDDGEGVRNGIKEKYGRQNIVVGNQFYEKWKGDWGQRPLEG